MHWTKNQPMVIPAAMQMGSSKRRYLIMLFLYRGFYKTTSLFLFQGILHRSFAPILRQSIYPIYQNHSMDTYLVIRLESLWAYPYSYYTEFLIFSPAQCTHLPTCSTLYYHSGSRHIDRTVKSAKECETTFQFEIATLLLWTIWTSAYSYYTQVPIVRWFLHSYASWGKSQHNTHTEKTAHLPKHLQYLENRYIYYNPSKTNEEMERFQ